MCPWFLARSSVDAHVPGARGLLPLAILPSSKILTNELFVGGYGDRYIMIGPLEQDQKVWTVARLARDFPPTCELSITSSVVVRVLWCLQGGRGERRIKHYIGEGIPV